MAFLSQLFTGNTTLEEVANNATRINRQLHNEPNAVQPVQQALLLWDPNCLPQFGADGGYGDETARAVARFKTEVLGVPAAEVIDDVGPRTVWRLDEIAFIAENPYDPGIQFAPKVVVKLLDDVATQLPYQDALQEALAPEHRAEWDALVAAFPGLELTLERALPAVDANAVRAWLSANEAASGTPSANLLAYFTISVPAAFAQAIADAVRTLPFVEHAYVEEETTLPTVTPDDPFIVGQGYLGTAPVGVDAPHVWALPFADGSAVHFVDVEHAWQLTHEDLIDTNGVNRIPVLFTGVTPLTDAAFIDHGTSVLGIVMATDNDKGILGLAPNAKGSVAPVQSPGGAVAVVAALVAIGTNPAIGAGSVVLIEQQDAQHHPVEMDLYTRHTILELTKKGITVVEAAGNGFGAGVDLDAVHQVFFGKIFDRNDGAFFDSGAVMVAASSSAVPHTRAIFSTEASNHGNRIDCYAWGENILTTQRLLDPTTNLPYTTSFPFGGTSGASAIVAGVAVVLQNIAFAVGGAFLTPGRLRDFLRDRNLNTRPAPPDDGRIGVMPDLAKLQPAILAP